MPPEYLQGRSVVAVTMPPHTTPRRLTRNDVRWARQQAHQGQDVIHISLGLGAVHEEVADAVDGRTWQEVTDPPPLPAPASLHQPAAAGAEAGWSSASAAARKVGLGGHAFQTWLAQHRIQPAQTPSGRLRYATAAVETALAAATRSPAPAPKGPLTMAMVRWARDQAAEGRSIAWIARQPHRQPGTVTAAVYGNSWACIDDPPPLPRPAARPRKRPAHARLTPEQVAAARQAARAGTPVNLLAADAKVGYTTMVRAVRGVTHRKVPEPPVPSTRRPALSAVEVRQAAAWMRQGAATRTIAAHLHVTPGAVHHRVHAWDAQTLAPDGSRWMATGEAARLAGVDRKTIGNWVRAGRLVWIWRGRWHWVSEASVRACLPDLGKQGWLPRAKAAQVAGVSARRLDHLARTGRVAFRTNVYGHRMYRRGDLKGAATIARAPDRWLSASQARTLTGLAGSELWSWAQRHHVQTKTTKQGDRRYLRADIEAVLAAQRPDA